MHEEPAAPFTEPALAMEALPVARAPAALPEATDSATPQAIDGRVAPAPPPDVAAEPGAAATQAAELSPAACAERLAQLFPALFTAPGAPGPAKPIKLRIHADIQARVPGVFSRRVLGIFFSRYTTSNAYLKAVASAMHRFDLDGQPAGEIAAEHRQAASEELARRHALAAERRAAQRPPARRDGPNTEGGMPLGATRTARRRSGPHEAMRDAVPPMPQPDLRPSAPPTARPPQDRRDGGRPSGHARSTPPSAAVPGPEATPQRLAGQVPRVAPADPAQRERALLLRNFEASPLSKANFCALKGMTEAALDAALAQAQRERAELSPQMRHAPPRPQR